MSATTVDVNFKYDVGSLVAVTIGARPPMTFPVLARISRATPHYRLDWTGNGFSPLLNDVPIPETSLQPANPA